jgi:hypothetical protein
MSFFSSELNTHGRLVIGFAAIVFTVSQIALGVSELYTPLSSAQYWIVVMAMFVASMAFCFVLMRLLVYGVLANYVLRIKLESFRAMPQKIEIACWKNEKILLIFPVSWFLSAGQKGGGKKRICGYLLCAFPAILITLALVLVLRLTTIEVIITQISQLFSFL